MSRETYPHLEALRDEMRRLNVDAVIIPGTDPHQSEYICNHWKFRDWISGFTGSNGTAVVTLDQAALWTDSRYFLQAGIELEDSGFVMMKENMGNDPTIHEWLQQVLEEDAVIAIDGRLYSAQDANQLERFCGENGFMLVTEFYPADHIWEDRPARPSEPAFVHDVQYAGEEATDKIERLLKVLEDNDATAMLVTALDDIAWLLNLRGGDIDFTPVAIAFAYISRRTKVLFIDNDKLTDEVRQHLKACDITVQDYDNVVHFLERVSEHEVVLIDPNRVSDTLANALPSQRVFFRSPITDLKSLKNEVQIGGFRHAMERDGAALARLFKWIEEEAPKGTINEVDVWKKGMEFRAQQDLYREDSFAMICGYKEHGAIVHYEATDESASTLHGEGILLVDSGAQYLDGTTDITRTITLGNPTAQEKHDFTLVLKGHLALQRAKFPTGTTGCQLDVLARMPLWQETMTYGHGTGHGVGHFLGCHEGPQSIRTNLVDVRLLPGMVLSNEPGLYKTGEYGIRTENLLLVVEDAKTEEFGNFLAFEPLTLFPYDLQLIDRSMLTSEEVAQINDYHRMVRERITPLLNAEEAAWLADKTREIN
ncbi:MAG: aminopeptidase P family protein [Muribaculaceae bacterium]|nr:aminopeptidase P family protein [Muribaculaceae bacterium]